MQIPSTFMLTNVYCVPGTDANMEISAVRKADKVPVFLEEIDNKQINIQHNIMQ